MRLDLRRHTVVPQPDSAAADSCPARNYPVRGMPQSAARDQAGGNDPTHLRSRANTRAVRAEMSKRGGITDEGTQRELVRQAGNGIRHGYPGDRQARRRIRCLTATN